MSNDWLCLRILGRVALVVMVAWLTVMTIDLSNRVILIEQAVTTRPAEVER